MSAEVPDLYPGEFFRVLGGSTVHGLVIENTDDKDLYGIRIETFEEAMPIGAKPFEQYVFRTQPEGQPSGPGDVDLVCYSLRKFLKLVSTGNPTLVNLLFVPPEFRYHDTSLATELRNLTTAIISQNVADRYAGYMNSQRLRLIGEKGQKRTGYARRLKYLSEGPDAYDTKYACHLIRLGLQGIELLTTGKLVLPIDEPRHSDLMAIGTGQRKIKEVLDWAVDLENDLRKLKDSNDLPPEPNYLLLNAWMQSVYMEHW